MIKPLQNPPIALAIAVTLTLLGANPSGANESIIIPVESPPSLEIPVIPPENSVPNSCSPLNIAGIERIIARSPERWGILVESIDRETLYYSHNADRFFIPASNTKLFTTAAALQSRSPDSAIRTKSLRDWVNVTNQRSNNAYAEALFKTIGGSRGVSSIIAAMGVNPDSFRLADGSGLSRRNLTTPRAVVEILRAMYYSPNRDTFQSSLPIAGVSGTLKNRLRNTPARGIVHAKTGTLRGVRALSGYLEQPDGRVMVFSIIANNPADSGQGLVRAIDSIVMQLSRPVACSTP